MHVGAALSVLLVAYVPGALIFRLPIAERSRRASLAAEERAFWGLILSIALSSSVALGLAAAGRYQFSRLLVVNGVVCLLILAIYRSRLRLGATATPPSRTALVPLALIVLGWWLNFLVPPAEYIIGGKDPGIYVNEGIQIAQRGTLIVADDVVSTVPPVFRGLFFRTHTGDPSYYSNRFMGFFLLDPQSGTVVGQFPQLFPASIAMAYGVDGLTGARNAPGAWAIVGLLAVYFLGARIAGRAAGAAGAGLLAVNVVQIWYARYPNAEIAMQPLVFAGLLAYTRAQIDEDPFFAPIAAWLPTLCMLTHVTGALVVAAMAAAAVLAWVDGKAARLSFWLPLVFGTGIALAYLARYVPPYFAGPLEFAQNLRLQPGLLVGLAGVGALGIVLLRAARSMSPASRARWTAGGLVGAVWTLAAYAFFVRAAGGSLAVHDADSLRTFTSFYLSPYGLAAALLGFAILARRMNASAAFLLTTAAFSLVFFYKIRIVPEHFWAARRFLAVTLPGALLLVGVTAFADIPLPTFTRFSRRWILLGRNAAGVGLVVLLAWQFLTATRPILRHVEYAGLIPRLEQLAGTFGPQDLILVESRNASDAHVLALPLAYIYARNVLVFSPTDPNKLLFREFLTWAQSRYRRVFFIGGGGTELLSRAMTVRPVVGERFQIPEYESPMNAYPRGVKLKEFDLAVYEFLPVAAPDHGFDLDVGAADDLYVRHAYAKERGPGGFSFRWTREVSFVSVIGTRPEQRTLTLWAGDGGRPPAAGPADIEVFLNETRLGAARVGAGISPYRFQIPAGVATAIAGMEDAAQLRIVTRTWSPARVLGGGDSRELGIMLDRVEIN